MLVIILFLIKTILSSEKVLRGSYGMKNVGFSRFNSYNLGYCVRGEGKTKLPTTLRSGYFEGVIKVSLRGRALP
jgi:hypothetical protein